MTNSDYFKYPDSDPVSKAVPELFPCPECDTDIEIWTDEAGVKCRSCNTYFKKTEPNNNSNTLLNALNKKEIMLKKLIEHAYRSGATEVATVLTSNIVIDDDLADRCREPRCENYGLSKSCPPHVSGPSLFRKQLEKYSEAIFFKIDVPSEILYSSERRELFQLLHETAAGIETLAVNMGFTEAQAYVGGSCKKIFCHEHPECLVISEKGKCRNPQHARPSMSGFGINVLKLFEAVGWTMNIAIHDTDSTTKTANVCGLVLIF